MEVLKKQALLEEANTEYRKTFLRFIWMIPAITLGLILAAAVFAGMKTNRIKWNNIIWAYAGGVALLFELINLLAFLSNRSHLRKADIEITEDVLLDEDYLRTRTDKIYYLLCLSGTVYPVSSSDVPFRRAMKEIYIVRIVEKNVTYFSSFYDKAAVSPEAELQEKVIRKCPVYGDDTGKILQQLRLLYGNDIFRTADGRKVDRVGYREGYPKCPQCGKRFKSGNEFTRTCVKCGARYAFTVSDLMVQKQWWFNVPLARMKLDPEQTPGDSDPQTKASRPADTAS